MDRHMQIKLHTGTDDLNIARIINKRLLIVRMQLYTGKPQRLYIGKFFADSRIVRMDSAKRNQPVMSVDLRSKTVDTVKLMRRCNNGQNHRIVNAILFHRS